MDVQSAIPGTLEAPFGFSFSSKSVLRLVFILKMEKARRNIPSVAAVIAALVVYTLALLETVAE